MPGVALVHSGARRRGSALCRRVHSPCPMECSFSWEEAANKEEHIQLNTIIAESVKCCGGNERASDVIEGPGSGQLRVYDRKTLSEKVPLELRPKSQEAASSVCVFWEEHSRQREKRVQRPARQPAWLRKRHERESCRR